MFFVSCDFQDSKIQYVKYLLQASCIELTLLTGIFLHVISFLQKKERRQG